LAEEDLKGAGFGRRNGRGGRLLDLDDYLLPVLSRTDAHDL
jgi:hypothetical protein